MAYLLLLLATLGFFAFASLPNEEVPPVPGTAQIQEHMLAAKDWTVNTVKTVGTTVKTKALTFLRAQLHDIIDETVQ